MLRAVVLLFFWPTLTVLAEKDSLRWDFRMKGVDIRIGGTNVQTNFRQTLNLFKTISPTPFVENGVILSWGKVSHETAKINVSAVFSNDLSSKFRWIKRKELRFGLNFEIQPSNNSSKTMDSIRSVFNPSFAQKVHYSYTYQCQFIDIGYQITSRTFLRHFALFTGLNAGFGVNTYRSFKGTDSYFYPEIVDDKRVNATFFNSFIHLGLKYNFSCDLNLFVQYEKGINVYGKPIGGYAFFEGGAFGIRYKIIDEQDKINYLDYGYW